jgi:hypothetical protein
MRTALFPAGRSQRGTSLLKVVVVLFVALFVILGVRVIYQKVTYKTPYRQAGDQFMTALAQNNASISYALFSDNLKNGTSASDWKQQLNNTFSGYSGKPKHVSDQVISDPKHLYGTHGQPHRIKYTLTIKGKNYAMYVIVFLQKTEWKIDEYDSVAI